MDVRVHLAPLVERLGRELAVQAVTVVGSRASGVATAESDIDLFVYVDDTPATSLLEVRRAIASDLAEPTRTRNVQQTGHAYADVYALGGTDVLLDVMWWTQRWAEDELDWRLVKQEPQAGYSTAFWRSIRDGLPVFERDDWHRRLQARARSPYPDLLRERIIAMNRDLLGRENPFSFLQQAAKAAATGDLVSVQHRAAKWLASWFDVVFAVNRVLSPGEKRLVAFVERECEVVPDGFQDDIAELLRLSAVPGDRLVPHLDRMVERLDAVLGTFLGMKSAP